jgi:hypothetical protein
MNKSEACNALAKFNELSASIFCALLSFACILGTKYALAQDTSSSVVNNAAPAATVSTNANGGTQINQQLNNTFDTSYGFGPGIICKTPQFLINANMGQTSSNLLALRDNTGNNQFAQNYSGGITLAIPLGSSVIGDCQRYVAQIAEDRVISGELSLLRACNQLKNEKLDIDTEKYPHLAKCLPSKSTSSPAITSQSQPSPGNSLLTSAKPPSYQRFNP